MNANEARGGCNGDRNARCGKNRSKNLGGRSANICDLRGRKCRYFPVLFGSFRVRFLLANMLQFLLANSSKRSQIWDICYICDHLRPHLQAKNYLLPANLLSACKSSLFAESSFGRTKSEHFFNFSMKMTPSAAPSASPAASVVGAHGACRKSRTDTHAIGWMDF